MRLATHRETGQQWACKIIPLPKPGRRFNENMSNRGAIMKEIDVLLGLDHPNVVALREYFVNKNKVGGWSVGGWVGGWGGEGRHGKGGVCVCPGGAAAQMHFFAAGGRYEPYFRLCSDRSWHRTRTAVPVPQVYLIMELLKGGELLDAVIETGHYGEGEARAIFQQIISAVKYLHSV